jgi:acyl-coenzyme A synthetase/AMP-(fatty) acid ligase
LNHHLNAIPGIQDGAFHMPDENINGEVKRVVAFVVAPDLQATEITALLRHKIDPAFLPRPLYKVDRLPRNATGKLPQSALTELLRTLSSPDTPKE